LLTRKPLKSFGVKSDGVRLNGTGTTTAGSKNVTMGPAKGNDLALIVRRDEDSGLDDDFRFDV
jgi:hypothetical protein